MQLGLTIPLQKFLKVQSPPYGALCDLIYCWELHRIQLQSKETLAAVNAYNRFAVVLCGMDASAWENLADTFIYGLNQAMMSEGYSREEIERYFKAAGKPEITRTHGRRSVSGLNRMNHSLWIMPVRVNEDRLFQPLHCHEVNREQCRMAGYEGYHIPSECFEKDMKRIGVIQAAQRRVNSI